MPNRLFDITSNPANPNPATGAGVTNAPQTVLTFAGATAAASLGINTST